MIKKLFFIISLILSLNAEDDLMAQKQNALYVQNLIEIEEKIAKMFEKYLLTEFKIPTMDNLRTDGYLGTNFAIKNMMGSDIGFESTTQLKLKYAISKNEFRIKKDSTENYIVQLYNRDLHRNNTSAYYDASTFSNSYTEILLQSDEAKTIFNILKSGKTIQKDCKGNSLVNTYCNNNAKTIRWHDNNESWIEYDKKEFNNGNVTISSNSMKTNVLLQDLAVGSYILIKDSSKYVKLINDASNNLQILKVE